MTIDEVSKALNEFFSDTSRSSAKTREGLGELQEELQTMLDALDEDLRG
jgi:hypothetical protein